MSLWGQTHLHQQKRNIYFPVQVTQQQLGSYQPEGSCGQTEAKEWETGKTKALKNWTWTASRLSYAYQLRIYMVSLTCSILFSLRAC